jgi:hypothetical protein
MGNESSILTWRIVLWAAPIVGALIALLANYKIDRLDTENKKEKEKIEAVRTEEREKKLQSLLTDSVNKKKPSKPRKKMEEKNKSGDTYNVTSNNQTGGITAGKIEINVPKQEQLDDLDIPLNENYVVKFDKTNLRFECNPKIGKWEKPYIAVLFEEKDTYKKFGCQSSIMYGVASGIDGVINDTRLWGSATGFFGQNEKPATNNFSYYADFNSSPSFIIFGNYEKVLYKYNTSNGTISFL